MKIGTYQHIEGSKICHAIFDKRAQAKRVYVPFALTSKRLLCITERKFLGMVVNDCIVHYHLCISVVHQRRIIKINNLKEDAKNEQKEGQTIVHAPIEACKNI